MTRPKRAPARLAATLSVVVLTLALAPAVLAHAELETSSPADGATVESPFDGPIVLDFTETLADGSGADLLENDGDVIASAGVDQPGAQMTFEFAAPLAPGVYEVRWTGVATDGHVDRGTFGFTVAPLPATPEPTPTLEQSATSEPTLEPSATAVPEPPAPSTPAPTPGASPTPGDGTTSGTGDVLIPIIVALVVVAAGGAYFLTRRNRPTAPR